MEALARCLELADASNVFSGAEEKAAHRWLAWGLKFDEQGHAARAENAYTKAAEALNVALKRPRDARGANSVSRLRLLYHQTLLRLETLRRSYAPSGDAGNVPGEIGGRTLPIPIPATATIGTGVSESPQISIPRKWTLHVVEARKSFEIDSEEHFDLLSPRANGADGDEGELLQGMQMYFRPREKEKATLQRPSLSPPCSLPESKVLHILPSVETLTGEEDVDVTVDELLHGTALECYRNALLCILMPVLPETPCSPKAREQLFKRMRCAFALLYPQHKRILDGVMHRSGIQHTLNELETRLEMLDSHPFYSKDAFESWDAYRSWKRGEIEGLTHLIRALRLSSGPDTGESSAGRHHSASTPANTSEPPHTPNITITSASGDTVQPPTPPDHHALYRLLLRRLVSYECPRANLDHALRGVPHEIQALSSKSFFILEEYGTRYGVGMLYRRLLWLHTLSEAFEHTAHHLELLRQALQDVIALFRSDFPAVATREETRLLQEASCELSVQARNRLLKYKKCFSRKTPRGLLRLLLDIFQALYEDPIRFSHEFGTADAALADIVRGACENIYEKLKMHIQMDLGLNPVDHATPQTEFTADGLIMLCDLVAAEVEEDTVFFETTFPRDFKLAARTATYFCQRVQGDVKAFCTFLSSASFTSEVLLLISKLQSLYEFFKEHAAGLPPTLAMLDVFHPVVTRWVRETGIKLQTWVAEACRVDKGSPVPNQLHSSSVVDLFCAITHAKSALMDLPKSLGRGGADFVEEFAMQVAATVVSYSHNLRTLVETNVTGEIQSRQCIWLNNLLVAKLQTNDLAVELERMVPRAAEAVGSCLRGSAEAVDAVLVESLRTICSGLEKPLQRGVERFLEANPTTSLDARTDLSGVLHFLDEQLETFAEHLYGDLMRRALLAIWTEMIWVLVDRVIPAESSRQTYLTADQRHAIQMAVEPLARVLHGSGEGLSMNLLFDRCRLLEGVLDMYDAETSHLIDLHSALATQERKDGRTPITPEQLHMSEVYNSYAISRILATRRKDREAVRYLEQIQREQEKGNNQQHPGIARVFQLLCAKMQ